MPGCYCWGCCCKCQSSLVTVVWESMLAERFWLWGGERVVLGVWRVSYQCQQPLIMSSLSGSRRPAFIGSLNLCFYYNYCSLVSCNCYIATMAYVAIDWFAHSYRGCWCKGGSMHTLLQIVDYMVKCSVNGEILTSWGADFIVSCEFFACNLSWCWQQRLVFCYPLVAYVL